MVDISFTLVTTTISTIIVVTMATLFFCCWRKKSSRDIVAGKHSRHTPTKEEVKIDRSGSLTPSAVGKSENGVVTDNQSATNGEMKLPLLSVTACADSNEDLGDFSAVQRETEILRSYRKPPPPKHRAKQTRAPRHMKNGNESSDIFTELSEEDLKNENISDKENIASYDDAGSSMLRSHSEDKPKSPREARSSMLADIEQTLAALYMSDESEVVQPVDSAPPEHKTGTTEPVPEVSVDNHGEKTVADMNPEPYAGDFVVSENTVSSTSQALISSEIKTESAPISLASSPKLHHTVTPKTGPKVSPKPSPKASARASSNNARTSANAPVTKHKDAHESISVSVSESAENESSLDPAVISFKCAVSQKELSTTDIGVPEETSSCLQTILKTSDETSTITEVEKPLDSTGSDILSIATDTVTISREGVITECTMIGTNDDKPETVKMSAMIKSSEKPITYNMSDEDTTTEISRGNTTESVSKEGEADFASQEQSESVTLVLDSKEQINTQSDANEVNKTKPASVAQGAKPIAIEQDEAIEQDTQQSVKGTVLTDESPQEDEKQKESSEDQTGKGKISKIPVRAGATSK